MPTGLVLVPTETTFSHTRLFARDSGTGKTQLLARFPTGAVQVVAVEP